jgi:hypothetical protein
MAVQTHQDFGMCLNTEPSPNQSPLSTSPSPEQRHSPQGNNMAHEHSWHIILEPHGEKNMVHFINPPTGEIISTYLADYGAMIEFEPGVYFQVPYPQQPGVPQMQPPPLQPAHQPTPVYSLNVSPQNIQNGVVVPNSYNSQEGFYNPYCPLHGNEHNYSGGGSRVEKRREKSQKKLRDKTCLCKQEDVLYNSYNARTIDNKMIFHHDGGEIMFHLNLCCI